MLQKTRGIVLHVVKHNDNTLIVDIYTEATGRGSFAVTVSHSPRAAVRSVLFQPLALLELEVDYRPNAAIHRVKEAKSHYPFSSLPYDPYKSAIALFLAEFLYRAVREETENRPLFAYLVHSITWLDACRGSCANFHLVFLLRLSRFLGVYPNVDNYHQGDYFDLQNGRFVSQRPGLHNAYIGPEEASRLPMLMRMRYETMHLLRLRRAERNRCLALLNDYYRLHLPGFPQLKSLEVLKTLFN